MLAGVQDADAPPVQAGLPLPAATPDSGGTAADPAAKLSDAAINAAFHQWLAAYQENPGAGRDAATNEAIVKQGEDLARVRAVWMKRLMREHPEQALREAVGFAAYDALPQQVRPWVEQPFSTRADYSAYPVCARPGESIPDGMADHVAALELSDGRRLAAFAYGRRGELVSKSGLPVQGIMLDEVAAVHDSVIRELQPGELAVAARMFGGLPGTGCVDGKPVAEDAVFGVAGGKVLAFANRQELEQLDKALGKLDGLPGPQSGSAAIYQSMPADGSAGFDLAAATWTAQAQASSWTESKKTVFFLRVDFPDKPDSSYPVVPAGVLASTLNTSVSTAILDMSYGKTWIEGTVSNQVTRLPNASTFYTPTDGGGSSNNDQLYTDAQAAYQAANPGFNFSDYDIVGVYFVSLGMRNGGVVYAAMAGGTRVWLQGDSSTGVITHELGHNYGVGHASFWTRSIGSTNPIDPSGLNDEYGDPFDIMGKGQTPEGHFHMQAKQRLNWLAAGAWTDVSAAGSGSYRVYRIDNGATTGVRGLRVTRGADDYYWIGYRRRIPGNNYLPSGAYVVWQRPGQNRSWLIDLTPNSQSGTADRDDCSQAIGKTYADTTANLYITPVAHGGTTPNEYLDVQVNIGPFPANVAPTASISGPATLDARKTALFTATASDPNGDELAYFWDFGGTFTTDNNPTVPYAWSVGGNYTVKLTVSDMHGGSVTVTKTVTVTDPLNIWTQQSNTAAGDFNAVAAGGGTIVAVAPNYSTYQGSWACSTTGSAWTAGQFLMNEHLAGIAHDGTRFMAVGQGHDGVQWVGLIKNSTDGATWTEQNFAGAPLLAVASSGVVSVAVGEAGTIRRSTNGQTWSAAASGTSADLTSVAWGNGMFVAVGVAQGFPNYSNGNVIILTSPDGLTWTDRTAGAAYLSNWKDFLKVGYGGGRFFASGWYAYIGTSADNGMTWMQAIPSTTRYDIKAFAYGNGVQLATGINRDNADAASNLITADGVNWVPLNSLSQNAQAGAAFFQNTFITVGSNHSIWQSNAFSLDSAGFVRWREANFPNHESVSTPTTDADADALPNLLEYALGCSPLSGVGNDGAAALPVAVVNSTNPVLTDRLALWMNLPEPAPTDIVYGVEASSTMAPGSWTPLATKTGTGAWTWLAGGTARIVMETAASGRLTGVVGDSAPLGSGCRFMRLKATVRP